MSPQKIAIRALTIVNLSNIAPEDQQFLREIIERDSRRQDFIKAIKNRSK